MTEKNSMNLYFAGLIKLPMKYHLCTGSAIPDAYDSLLAEKCDADNNTFYMLTSSIYSVTFLFFGLLVLFKSVIKQRQVTRQVNTTFQVCFIVKTRTEN